MEDKDDPSPKRLRKDSSENPSLSFEEDLALLQVRNQTIYVTH